MLPHLSACRPEGGFATAIQFRRPCSAMHMPPVAGSYLRSARHRRRHQWRRHRARRRRTRPVGAAGEQDDLAAHTSSWSTKLIHGGLRYLEYFEFRLVAEALAEREVLLRTAPHIIEPLAFVLPHEPHLRPAWMIRAGLFLYDHLGGRMTLPKSFGVELAAAAGAPACKPQFRTRLRLRRCARRRCAAGRAPTRSTRERRRGHPRAHHAVTGARAKAALWRAHAATHGGARVGDQRAGDRQRRRPVGEATCSDSVSDRAARPRTCATSRAATSSCRACIRKSTPTSCRMPTSGSCS